MKNEIQYGDKNVDVPIEKHSEYVDKIVNVSGEIPEIQYEDKIVDVPVEKEEICVHGNKEEQCVI